MCVLCFQLFLLLYDGSLSFPGGGTQQLKAPSAREVSHGKGLSQVLGARARLQLALTRLGKRSSMVLFLFAGCPWSKSCISSPEAE